MENENYDKFPLTPWELFVFVVACALCILFMCSCSTQRVVMTEYVHDTLMVRSVVHDTVRQQTVRTDTLIVTQTVREQTVITQDSAGQVINRETMREVSNDTYHGCGMTERDYQKLSVQDSVASSRSKESHVTDVSVRKESWWTRFKNQLLQTIGIVIVLMIGFIIGKCEQRIRQVLHL